MPTIDKEFIEAGQTERWSQVHQNEPFSEKCESRITNNKSGRVFDPLLIVKRLDRIILPTPTHIITTDRKSVDEDYA